MHTIVYCYIAYTTTLPSSWTCRESLVGIKFQQQQQQECKIDIQPPLSSTPNPAAACIRLTIFAMYDRFYDGPYFMWRRYRLAICTHTHYEWVIVLLQNNWSTATVYVLSGNLLHIYVYRLYITCTYSTGIVTAFRQWVITTVIYVLFSFLAHFLNITIVFEQPVFCDLLVNTQTQS